MCWIPQSTWCKLRPLTGAETLKQTPVEFFCTFSSHMSAPRVCTRHVHANVCVWVCIFKRCIKLSEIRHTCLLNRRVPLQNGILPLNRCIKHAPKSTILMLWQRNRFVCTVALSSTCRKTSCSDVNPDSWSPTKHRRKYHTCTRYEHFKSNFSYTRRVTKIRAWCVLGC